FFVKDKGLLVNRGIAGDNTEFVMKRFEADVLQLRPETVVLKIGVNDIWVLEDYPWVIGPRKHSSEEIINPIISRISKMIDLAIEQNINIAVCSILPSNMTWTAHNGERNVIIAEINQRLKQISNEKKAIYVDFHSHFADPDGLTLRNGLTDDGLHPHVVGYEIMAQVLSNTLMEHGIKLQTI
ncbi:MAG: G-D-S-L family lipolytic protein, partial [Vallitaleaceae bacterium]|nr:G-D-S-L family lipolytic protein [Vallitaleaceae bacterium]